MLRKGNRITLAALVLAVAAALLIAINGTAASADPVMPPGTDQNSNPTVVRGNNIGGNRWGGEVIVGGSGGASIPGSPQPSASRVVGPDAKDVDSADEISIGPGECQWKFVTPPPDGDPRWEGNDPSTGSVITRS